MSRSDRTDAPPMGLLARFVRRILFFIYKRYKFTAVGTPPELRRFVIIAVPHTSNWDFPNYVGLTHELGLDTHFMAKDSLFKWPIGKFMRQVGGVPVTRDANRDMVQQMVDEFAKRDEFVLTVAPEGTRQKVAGWRTGFYRIAHGAGVPIVCGFMDYERRRAGVGPIITPTGDYDADMEPAFAFYRDILGKRGPGSD
ncbi:acyltransferase [Parasphingopyxis sp. CP4]|uniref:lysophospholipid acyltransferase family protein n=1 Tax=Parasphingopyxis sp. CP4 TaxID=2724527 RepID=UPI0015A2603A|nr:lysophospholipid acyltransferase family protein [Parasphingopyxis sp. CP4]QLC22782.1 acyltransferase [Parasphingopyxis sp. CP4]